MTCAIVGDSIALGTAEAEGLAARYRPPCSVNAKIGNPGTRSLRVFEEGAELAQACDVPYELAEQCLRDVYSRKKGDVSQEVGGVLMTIFLFIAGIGWMFGGDDPVWYFVTELRRVLKKEAEKPGTFAARNAQKIEVPRPARARLDDLRALPMPKAAKECSTCGGNCGQGGGPC